MGRFKHVNDVERNEDGTLVYTGGHYRIAGDAVERKRTLISFTAGTVMLAVLIILSGCIDADNATKSFTVIIPLIGEVCCLFAICWQAVKVIAGAAVEVDMPEETGENEETGETPEEN